MLAKGRGRAATQNKRRDLPVQRRRRNHERESVARFVFLNETTFGIGTRSLALLALEKHALPPDSRAATQHTVPGSCAIEGFVGGRRRQRSGIFAADGRGW